MDALFFSLDSTNQSALASTLDYSLSLVTETPGNTTGLGLFEPDVDVTGPSIDTLFHQLRMAVPSPTATAVCSAPVFPIESAAAVASLFDDASLLLDVPMFPASANNNNNNNNNNINNNNSSSSSSACMDENVVDDDDDDDAGSTVSSTSSGTTRAAQALAAVAAAAAAPPATTTAAPARAKRAAATRLAGAAKRTTPAMPVLPVSATVEHVAVGKRRPEPEEYATPAAYDDAYRRWRAERDSNNHSVKLSRERAKLRREEEARLERLRARETRSEAEQLAAARAEVALLVKKVAAPHLLTRAEEIQLAELLQSHSVDA